jgi:phosphohistidine phosphatase
MTISFDTFDYNFILMPGKEDKSFSQSPSDAGSKILLLIRHAKSDWDDSSLKDFDRPLNERGKNDAPKMAHRLLDKNISIDALIASPAKRAKKTARLFAEVFKKNEEEIIYKPELYLPGLDVFYTVVENTNNKFNTIAIFSHNPGITEFAYMLTPKSIPMTGIPTCGIFAVRLLSANWKDIKTAEKEFLFFDYPKA